MIQGMLKTELKYIIKCLPVSIDTMYVYYGRRHQKIWAWELSQNSYNKLR